MNDPQPVTPRRRMQELLDIPDNQRTEAEWDELNELEIQLAPVNREGAPEPRGRTGQAPRPRQQRPPPQQISTHQTPGNAAGAPQHPKRTVKRFRRRPPKAPPSQPT